MSTESPIDSNKGNSCCGQDFLELQGMNFAPEAIPFVAPFGIAALAAAAMRKPRVAAALLGMGTGVLLFFRDPARSFVGEESIVLAAADGLVTRIDTVEDPDVGPGRLQRVVTFLSVFDVHVQRCPVAGEVVRTQLSRGQKVAAFREDAGEVNEQFLTVIESNAGDLVGIRQIAGLLARRVVGYLQPGQRVERGDHLGVIKFGSRVDILLPEDYEILVEKGDRLKNGETPVARRPERDSDDQ